MNDTTGTPARAWLRRHPDTVTDGLQIAKTVLATVVAWWIVTELLDSDQPFLAPWTALMTVHATVYRTLKRGAQTMLASFFGVIVAFAVGVPLGVDVISLAVAMTIGMAASRLGLLRQEGVAVATTALFIMAGHDQHDVGRLVDRLVEVAIGLGVGFAVNAIVLPPLRNRQAQSYVQEIHCRIGELLIELARELRESWDTDRSTAWVKRAEQMDTLLDAAWAQVRFAGESARWNPRSRTTGDARGSAAVLTQLHEGVSQLRHLVRTIDGATHVGTQWDEEFRERWLALVEECGRRLIESDADVGALQGKIDDLAARMSRADLPDLRWPFYGSLITSLRHIVWVADSVASRERSGRA